MRTTCPFPGMDPWLENPGLWTDFHDRLITYLCDRIQEGLPERYFAHIQDRVYLEWSERMVVPDVSVVRRGREPGEPTATRGTARPTTRPEAVLVEDPAFEIREPFIEIRDSRTGGRVATVIEILSPSNKREGSDGRREYREKQGEVVRSEASLMEVDLLRGGSHTVAVRADLLERHRPYDYLVVVSRAQDRRRREVFPVPLPSPLPVIGVPLREPDPDVEIDLGALVYHAWTRGAYGKKIDYAKEPVPPLSEEHAIWARERLAGTKE